MSQAKQAGLFSTLSGAIISTVRESAVAIEATIGMASDVALAGRAYTTEMKLSAQLETQSNIRLLTKELAKLESEA